MLEVFAYMNVNEIVMVLNAVASVLSAPDFIGLMKVFAMLSLLGFVIGVLTGAVQIYGYPVYLIGMAIVLTIFTFPRNVAVIDRTGNQPTQIVSHVPLGMALIISSTSHIGDYITRGFEAVFSLPNDLRFQKNGLMFGSRMVSKSRKVEILDHNLRYDITLYIRNCVNPDLLDGYKKPEVLRDAPNLWAVMGDTNPARWMVVGGGATPKNCPDSYVDISLRWNAEIQKNINRLGRNVNPYETNTAAANSLLQSQFADAFPTMLGISASALDVVQQNMMINMYEDAEIAIASQMNNTAAVQIALAKAQAETSMAAQYATTAKIAETLLPQVRNVLEILIFAMFPFVVLMMLLVGIGGWAVLKQYCFAVFWLQLWAPLYAILNFVMTNSTARQMKAALADTTGITMGNVSALQSISIEAHHIAGMLSISIPVLAWAIVKGAEMGGSSMLGGTFSTAQKSADTAAGSVASGNVNVGNAGVGNATWGTNSSSNWSSGNFSNNNTQRNNDSQGNLQKNNASSDNVQTGNSSIRNLQKDNSSVNNAQIGNKSIGNEQIDNSSVGNVQSGNNTSNQTLTAPSSKTHGASYDTPSGAVITQNADGSQTVNLPQNNTGGLSLQAMGQLSNAISAQATTAIKAAQTQAASAQQQQTAAIAQLAAGGSSKVDSQQFSKGTSAEEGKAFARNHAKVQSMIDEVSKSAGVDKSIAAQAVFGVSMNFGLKAGLDSKLNAATSEHLNSAAKKSLGENRGVVDSYTNQLKSNESFAASIATGQTQSQGVSASLTQAQTSAKSAQASLEQAQALQNSAQAGKSVSSSMGVEVLSLPFASKSLAKAHAAIDADMKATGGQQFGQIMQQMQTELIGPNVQQSLHSAVGMNTAPTLNSGATGGAAPTAASITAGHQQAAAGVEAQVGVDPQTAFNQGKPNTAGAKTKVTGSAKLQGARAQIQAQGASMGKVSEAGKRELTNQVAQTTEDIKNSTVGVLDLPSPKPKYPVVPETPAGQNPPPPDGEIQ
jgi:conjugal transfer mating pair stabilization protein TraG